MVHVQGLGVSTRFSHCRIHGALYLEPIICIYIDLLLYMSRNYCTCSTNMCFWGIPNHPHDRNEQYLLSFGPQRPKAPHPPDPPHKLQLLPPGSIQEGGLRTSIGALSYGGDCLSRRSPKRFAGRAASECPWSLRKKGGFGRGEGWWRYIYICLMPKFDSWRLMFPETATKDWSSPGDYTLHGSFFGIEGLYLFLSFTRFCSLKKSVLPHPPYLPAKAPFLNAAWKL